MAHGVPVYEQWFRAADRDRNGWLSPKELKQALRRQGYKTKRKQFKEMMRRFDRNKDKKITLQEYLAGMTQVPPACHQEVVLRQGFRKADRNNDGVLTLDELHTILSLPEIRAAGMDKDDFIKMAKKMDKDKNGRINYNEYLRYFLKQHDMSDCSSSSSSDSD